MKMATRIGRFVWLLLVVGSTRAQQTATLFPSGDSLVPVDPSTLENSEEYVDPENTGSLLYSAEGVESRRVGKNIMVSLYRSDQSVYFRAHPGFMQCAQEVILSLLREDIRVDIVEGYKLSSEVTTDDVTERFLRTGCAIELEPRTGDRTQLGNIASTVLRICPVIFERYYRDVGLVLLEDRVHFHMSGPSSTGPLIRLDGYTAGTVTDSNLMTWALNEINAGLDPLSVPTCVNFTSVPSGEQYPAGVTIDAAVGSFDEAVTRAKETDFRRLIQYQGTSIEFSDEESDSSWCGEPDLSCPPCRDWISGNTLQNRCADRLMSSRLINLLNKLQKKARDSGLPTLRVLEAWDEPHSGGQPSTTDLLHQEGRAVTLELTSSNTADNLATLAKYASCLGADYIENRGTHLFIAAKRMQGSSYAANNKKMFPNLELLAVDPPSSVSEEYALPSTFTSYDLPNYPLFDGAGRENVRLSESTTIGMFMSEGYRYFRLNPRLHDCFVSVVYAENQRKASTDPRIQVEVVTGFLSNGQDRMKFDVATDKRSGAHNLGVAMQIRYRDAPAGYTPVRLLYTVIDKCAPIFNQESQEMGLGLYRDSVFVDLRDQFEFFRKTDGEIPSSYTFDEFDELMENRFLAARSHRVVDPDNREQACTFANPPKPQSCDFVHEHSEHVKRRRRRRQTTQDPDECIPNRDTAFCRSTVQEREEQIAAVMSQLDRKHYRCHPRETIEEAVRKCFGLCGTCLEGEVFEEKTLHCNNLLHWVDWTTQNQRANVTNIYVRKNENARRHACENGGECIERAPLFALFAPTVDTIYRPDKTKSVEELLYASADNPSPVFRLIEDIYTIHATGVVKIWVYDDTEMTTLKRQLEVLMLYNRNVTLLEIYVERFAISSDAVKSVVESAATGMVTLGCPAVSREVLTPYVIKEIPHDVRKRAAEPQSVAYHIRKHWQNFEGRWLDQNKF